MGATPLVAAAEHHGQGVPGGVEDPHVDRPAGDGAKAHEIFMPRRYGCQWGDSSKTVSAGLADPSWRSRPNDWVLSSCQL